jgi:hypothetical protein
MVYLLYFGEFLNEGSRECLNLNIQFGHNLPSKVAKPQRNSWQARLRLYSNAAENGSPA